jgi:DNA polymerase (family 10)
MQDAQRVTRELQALAALLSFGRQPKFKVQAYERAALVVETVGSELAALVEQNRLRELQGIGETLDRQIQELWNTGSSEFLQKLRSESPPGAEQLIRVPSLTPKRIRALHDKLGITSVDDLRAACLEQRVQRVPGFGAKTEARLLQACDRWLSRVCDAAPQPLLLSRGLEVTERLRAALAGIGRAEVAGALRRGEETVSELDLVVLGERERALSALARLRHVLRVDRESGVAYLTDRIVVRVHAADQATWGNVLVRATGDAAHVQALEAVAHARGLSLDHVRFASESALYEALGLACVPAELRYGDIALAQAERGPFTELVTASQLRGLVHCHTTYSDGKDSVLQMARAAHALGMDYITITDHSPSAHYAAGVSLDRLKAQWDEIAAAQEQVPIRILRGTESDILSDGRLDYPDSVLEQFDLIIASIHARHRMSRDEMTRRIARAMALPFFKIWGHGLGRILNHRPPIDCDVLSILDALATGGGAVELNSDPHRLDLPPAWIPAARERGIPFVISVDAHSTAGLGISHLGVTMARRGALAANEVLNTLGAADFVARVCPGMSRASRVSPES